MKNKAVVELTDDEVEALAFVAFTGAYVINSQRKNPIKKYDDLFNRVVDLFVAQRLKSHPEEGRWLGSAYNYFLDKSHKYLCVY